MSRARRKMRRKLMKQMRKGSLSAAERRELLELDREVNRANRQGAAIGAAGLGTALAIANKAGAGDALSDFLDERKEKRTEKKKAKFQDKSQKAGDKISDQVKEDAKKELMDSLPKDRSGVSIRDMEIAEMQDIKEDEENFEDKDMNDTLIQYQMEKAKATSIPDGPVGPDRSNEGFQEAQRVQAEREAMQEFRDSAPTEAEETAARRQRLLDERMMQDDMGNMEMIVGPGREQGFDDPIGLGAMPAGSGIPFRMDGPRVSNEYGGNTPFLRKMRDRIRKKFR